MRWRKSVDGQVQKGRSWKIPAEEIWIASTLVGIGWAVLAHSLGFAGLASIGQFLRDVGKNAGSGALPGAAGAGASGGLGWPGGIDPYPNIPMPDDAASGQQPGKGDGQGDGKDPWWKDFIPHNLGPLNLFTGRMEGGGTIDAGHGVSVTGKGDFGAAPGSDPSGPIVDANYNVSVHVDVGPVEVSGSVSGHATAGISQQVQNAVSAGYGGQTVSGNEVLHNPNFGN